MVEPAGQAVLRLRRYHSIERDANNNIQDPCPGAPGNFSYHNASVPFMTIEEGIPRRTDERPYWPSHDELAPPDYDKRWPTKCDKCDYEFSAADPFQVFSDHLYCRLDDRTQRWVDRELPIGAMFDAFWLPWTGPDGQSLSVITPPGGINHVWHIDMPVGDEGNKQPWTRTGQAPLLVVTPSILTPKYHGFLGSNGAPAGWLSDTLGDRPDPFS